MDRFTTKSEAIAVGYTPANARLILDYQGCQIVSADISGPNEYGYRFGIRVKAPHYGLYHPYSEADSGHLEYCAQHFSGTDFAVSSSVSLSGELSIINQRGCVSVMYSASQYEQGIASAKAAIDAYRAAFPELSHREVARHLGREDAIDAEIERLRGIDAGQPISDERLARICRNTISVYHRPEHFRMGEFKRILLSGQGPDHIGHYLADSDQVFDRLFHTMALTDAAALASRVS